MATSLRKSVSELSRRILREPEVERFSESELSRRNLPEPGDFGPNDLLEPDVDRFSLSVSSFNARLPLSLRPDIIFLMLSNERLLLIQVSFKRNLSSSRKDTIVSRMMSYQNDIF